MIDITAPIIPGESIGGIRLGTPIENVLMQGGMAFEVEERKGWDGVLFYTYRSSSLRLWVKNGRISQIMAHGDYQGKLLDVIEIGMTCPDLEARFGKLELDIYDNPVLPQVPGVSFEYDVESNPSDITEIYVFDASDD
jgi:hypothetical protein